MLKTQSVMVVQKDITMNTRRKSGGWMKTELRRLETVYARSVAMPYDEIYYQRMEDETNLVKEISIAIKRVVDRMGKRSCA